MLRLWTNVTVSPTPSPTQLVGHLGHGGDLGPPGREQRHDLVDLDLLPGQDAVEDLVDRSTGVGGGPSRDEGRGRVRGPGVPCRRTGTDVEHLDAVVDLLGRRGGDPLHEHRARVVAPEPLGVAAVHDREAHRRVEPADRVVDVGRMGRESRGDREAARLGDGSKAVERRPGALRVDVVRGDRGDAAPVVDPGVEQHPEVVGEVRWRLQVHVGRQDEASQGDGVEVDVGRAGSGGVHGGACLRQEVLDDHLLHVAVATMRGRDGLERLDAVGSVLSDPDEDPRGERDGQLPGPLEGVEAAAGSLVGRTPVAVEVGAQRLDHHPLGGADRTERGQLVSIEGPRVGVREQPGLVEDQLGHRREVVDGRSVAVARRATRRRSGSAAPAARRG